jgi:hypothetical protein
MNIKSPMKTANQKWVFVSLESPHHTWGYSKQKQWMEKKPYNANINIKIDVFGPDMVVIVW